jgi:hypothetical protein
MTSNLNVLPRKKMGHLTFIWMKKVPLYLPDEFLLTQVSFLMSILNLNFNFSPKCTKKRLKYHISKFTTEHWLLRIHIMGYPLLFVCLFICLFVCLKRSWYQIVGRYILGWNPVSDLTFLGQRLRVCQVWCFRLLGNNKCCRMVLKVGPTPF